MNKNFGGVIWTNHAIEKLQKRGIKQGDAWATFNRPDQSRSGKTKGVWVYYKTYGDERIEVVAKKDGKGKWIILSVWKKPFYGKKSVKPDSLLKLLWKRIFKK